MKTLTRMVSVGLVTGLLATGCASGGMGHHDGFPNAAAANSIDQHVAAIQQYEQRAAALEQKIQQLAQRIETFHQKPYRDPKGFRRSSWKRLVGTWQEQLKGLRQHIAWHENEIARLQTSDKKPAT